MWSASEPTARTEEQLGGEGAGGGGLAGCLVEVREADLGVELEGERRERAASRSALREREASGGSLEGKEEDELEQATAEGMETGEESEARPARRLSEQMWSTAKWEPKAWRSSAGLKGSSDALVGALVCGGSAWGEAGARDDAPLRRSGGDGRAIQDAWTHPD
jgi:hypothetical protein